MTSTNEKVVKLTKEIDMLQKQSESLRDKISDLEEQEAELAMRISIKRKQLSAIKIFNME